MQYDGQRPYGYAHPSDFVPVWQPNNSRYAYPAGPYDTIGPGGAPLIAQPAPIYAGPYTGWGWGYGASLRGYEPGYAGAGMEIGNPRFSGFAPAGPGFAPAFAAGNPPGFAPSGYAPANGPNAFADPGSGRPVPPGNLAVSGVASYAAFLMPSLEQAAFAPPPVSSGQHPMHSAHGGPAPARASPATPSLAASFPNTSSRQHTQPPSGAQRAQTSQSGSYSGVGPQDYVRSDLRIHEDIHDRMTAHGNLDARGITISVDHGVVTLNGVVPDRQAKRLAEDIADGVSGVKDVLNHVSVQPQRFAHNHPQAAMRR